MADFRSAGVDVVGASTDSKEKNAKFAQTIGADYPLLSDEDATAVRSLGIDSGSGRAKRTTFLIDSFGVIRKVWEDVKIDGHDAAVLKTVRSLGL